MKTKPKINYKIEADRIAAEHGGHCLTIEISTFNSKVIWKCFNPNHPKWTASFASVKGNRTEKGTWCDPCFRERLRHILRLPISEVRDKLHHRGIELVSKDYFGIEHPIICRCLQCEHIWTTRLRHINHGHGCPECGKKRNAQSKCLSAKQIEETLTLRRLTLLEVKRTKPRTTVAARCNDCGLEWTAALNDLRQGRGCPRCGRKPMGDKRRTPKEKLRTQLVAWGLELLSDNYRDNKTKLHVRFVCGHEGFVSFNSLQRGDRCSACAPNARVTEEDYRLLANLHGGKLVTTPATANKPAQWKCRKEHTFSRPYSNIKQSGTFCPRCNEGLSERICRAAVEQLFGTPFKKVKLRGVRGIGGRYLELDAYSELLKFAIEHNGQQHYQPIRFGNQTEAETTHCFHKQQEHDRRRREFCATNGITLIEVPELGRKTKVEDLKDLIRLKCEKANFKLPDRFDRVQLKLDAYHLATTAEEMWERVVNRVQQIGYTLKTKNYPGANGRLSLVCKNGHEYKPIFATFLYGHACQRCLIQKRAVPVVVLSLGAGSSGYSTARVFDTIQDCARALKLNPNNVRTVAKGRGKSCMGFGVAQITSEQAGRFRENKEELEKFCCNEWPSPENYDRQDGARKHNSKPVQFLDGRKFPSRTAAAKVLGVTKTAIYFAVRTGSSCKGHFIQAGV